MEEFYPEIERIHHHRYSTAKYPQQQMYPVCGRTGYKGDFNVRTTTPVDLSELLLLCGSGLDVPSGILAHIGLAGRPATKCLMQV